MSIIGCAGENLCQSIRLVVSMNEWKFKLHKQNRVKIDNSGNPIIVVGMGMVAVTAVYVKSNRKFDLIIKFIERQNIMHYLATLFDDT